VRGEDHLRTDVTLRNGSHDGEPPDLSSNVRLSSTRRVVRSTPGLPKQRLEFLSGTAGSSRSRRSGTTSGRRPRQRANGSTVSTDRLDGLV
jgi:hypothetical protein